MASHSSATVRERASHANRTTRTTTIINALRQRAQSVIDDKLIHRLARLFVTLWRRMIRGAELVRRADAGEAIVDRIDFSQTSLTNEDYSKGETIEALAEMICQNGDEPGIRSAALLLLMVTLENTVHPKALAKTARHLAFTRCSELLAE